MLLEVGESRRELHISEGENVAAILEEEIGKTLNKAVTVRSSAEPPRPEASAVDFYVLQRWSTKWDAFVDIQPSQVTSGDRISAVLQSPVASKVW